MHYIISVSVNESNSISIIMHLFITRHCNGSNRQRLTCEANGQSTGYRDLMQVKAWNSHQYETKKYNSLYVFKELHEMQYVYRT